MGGGRGVVFLGGGGMVTHGKLAWTVGGGI